MGLPCHAALVEDLLLLFVAGHAFRLASRWPEKLGCLASARNVAGVAGYSPSGFLAVACRPDNRAPSARRYSVLAAHANIKVDLQVSAAWQETLRPLTQSHVWLLLKRPEHRTAEAVLLVGQLSTPRMIADAKRHARIGL